jgi:signal transduction histidine kinase
MPQCPIGTRDMFSKEGVMLINQFLSHDLRGPLSSAIGLLKLIQEKPDLLEYLKYLALLENCLKRMDHTIHQLNEQLNQEAIFSRAHKK